MTGLRKGPQLARGRTRPGDSVGARRGCDSREAAGCWEPGDADGEKGERGREGRGKSAGSQGGKHMDHFYVTLL